jgi:glycine/D-amino acid oxidase-like deaminating enzyme/nitrite reductase/ring-hydroxylating ferredoxin subunit
MAVANGSVWGESIHTKFAGASGDLRCDVCVIGAGIAGLTTAYLLAREGRQVVVLDAKKGAAAGETAYTTAHLAGVLDDRFSRVESIRGQDVARLAAASHAAAIDFIETTAREEGIDCDFHRVDGFLFPGPGDKPDVIDEEEQSARRLGVAVERLDKVPLPAAGGGPCLRFPNQARFHPLKYLDGLAQKIRDRGGRIVTSAVVNEVESGKPAKVVTAGGPTVTADAVVIATNVPFNAGVGLLSRLAYYTTYAFAADAPASYAGLGLFWDTLDPYHYVRVQPNRDGTCQLIVGGEDHKHGQADDQAECWDRLEVWARERFPEMGKVRYRWSGEVIETLDGLAHIGPDGADNVFIATGDSGMGLTHGTIAGQLLTDLILGRPNQLADVYAPHRTPVKAAGTFLQENLNLAAQFKDWVTGGDVSSADDVKPGEGAVIRRGLTKVAVYRDEDGAVHELSAVCPHMGCVVHWNGGEQCWDCPCHGSRFTAEGKMTHGPAVSDLEPVEQEEPARR